jgi:signal peptidase I
MKENLLKLYKFSNSWTGTIIIVLLVIFFVAQAFVIPSGSMIRTLLVGDHLFVKKFAYGVPTPHIPFLEIPLVPNHDGHLIEGERPKRGDIVVFRYPLNEKIHFVKRCVAVSGDELFFHNQDLYLHPVEGDEYARNNFKGYELVSIGGKMWVKNPYQNEHKGIHYENPKIVPQKGDTESEKILYDPYIYYSAKAGVEPVYETPLSILEPEEVRLRKYFFGPITLGKDRFFMMGDNRDNSADSRYWGPVSYSQIVGKPWFIYFSWDDNYLIRWNRIGKSIETLESELK